MNNYKNAASCAATVATYRQRDLNRYCLLRCGLREIPETEIVLAGLWARLQALGVPGLPSPEIASLVVKMHPSAWDVGIPDPDVVTFWTSDEGRSYQHQLIAATSRDALAASMPIDWRPWWLSDQHDLFRLYFWALCEISIWRDDCEPVSGPGCMPLRFVIGAGAN